MGPAARNNRRFPVMDTFDEDGDETGALSHQVAMQLASGDGKRLGSVSTWCTCIPWLCAAQFIDAFAEMPMIEFHESADRRFLHKRPACRRHRLGAAFTTTCFRPLHKMAGISPCRTGSRYFRPLRPVPLDRAPIDDTNTHGHRPGGTSGMLPRMTTPRASRTKARSALASTDFYGQDPDRPYEMRQRDPGDYDAWVSQGSKATSTARENLSFTDRGVAKARRLLAQRDPRHLQKGNRPEAADRQFCTARSCSDICR